MLIPLGILAGQVAAPAGTYELISTQVLTSAAASVTFSAIPQAYKHLQIRGVARIALANNSSAQFLMRLNGNTNSIYSHSTLTGTGSSVFTANVAGIDNRIALGVFPATTETSEVFAPFVIDLLDSSSASKTTTAKIFTGYHGGAVREIRLMSGHLNNTSAVTSLQFFLLSGSIATSSRFSLYGIKA